MITLIATIFSPFAAFSIGCAVTANTIDTSDCGTITLMIVVINMMMITINIVDVVMQLIVLKVISWLL